MNWINLMNGEGINDYSKMFGVKGYPTKIIVDKEGKVVKVFVGGGKAFYELLDKLLQ